MREKIKKTQNSFLLRRHFDDFDDLADSACGWNFEFKQLDRGAFRGEILQIKQGPVLLSRFFVNRRLEINAGHSGQSKIFGIPVHVPQPFVWRGNVVPQPTLQLFDSHDDIEAMIPPNFSNFTFSIPEDRLGELCHSLKLPFPKELSGAAKVTHCDPASLYNFHQTLRQLDRRLANASSVLTAPWLSEQLEFEIPQQLLSLLSGAAPKSPQPSPRQRTRALKNAVAYIKEYDIISPPTVRELYQATGVSKRTLEYAFQEHFGVSPKAYLQAYRLNGVRKALRKADPNSTIIADIANRWGFWHMGHFANDYRMLFGELPSETLNSFTHKESKVSGV